MKINFNLAQLSSGILVPVLVLAGVAGGYFLVYPKFQAVLSHREVAASKKLMSEDASSRLISIQELVADLEKKSKGLKTVDEALPEAPRIPELLVTLDYLAKQSGLSVESLQITLAPTLKTNKAGQDVSQVLRVETILSKTQNLEVMQIDLALKGQYQNLKSFLGNVEQSLRLLDILTLVIGVPEEKSGSQDYSLRMLTYYQKE